MSNEVASILLGIYVNPKFLFCFVFCFSRQGFSVALKPVLELALVAQAGQLTEIHAPLTPKCWD